MTQKIEKLLAEHIAHANAAASARMCGLGEVAREHQAKADAVRLQIKELTDGK